MTTEKASTSSAKTPSEQEIKETNELMSIGKRHLICNEPEKALDYFVELCERLAEMYGQTADECADAYLHYGKTLIELARQEIGVFWNAVKETPVLQEEEEDEGEDAKGENNEKENDVKENGKKEGDEKMMETEKSETENEEPEENLKPCEIKEKVSHAMREGNLYNDATTEEDTEPEEENEESENKDDTTTTKTNGEQGEEEQPEDECGDQDVSHMELAWEMLELTCSICSRMIEEKKDDKKVIGMMAEARYGLAQISMEQEQYERAIEDFKSCLEHYSSTLEDKCDRRIAEVHYNIGLAYSFDKNFGDAIGSYKEAKQILETRLKMLKLKIKKQEETSGKEKASPELNEWNKEIKELEDLVLLDMNAKIEDAEESKKQAAIEIEELREKTKDVFGAISSATGFDAGFGFDEPSQTEVVVHDVTTKVRSVKRPSDDESATSSDAKKAKRDENSNEESKSNVQADEKPTSIIGA